MKGSVTFNRHITLRESHMSYKLTRSCSDRTRANDRIGMIEDNRECWPIALLSVGRQGEACDEDTADKEALHWAQIYIVS